MAVRSLPRSWYVAALLCAVNVPVLADDSIDLQHHVRLVTQLEPLPLPPAQPEPEVGLSLAELEQMALAANPSVRRLQALVAAARANAVQVGLYPNPSIGYEGQQLGSGGLAEQHGVLFSQEIVRGGKLGLNRAVANRERMQMEQQLVAQQQRVLTDIRTAFYQVLLAQQQMEVTADLIHIGIEGSQAVDELFRANEVGKADILQAQLETENARILSENAKNRYNAAWQSLAAVLGDPSFAPEPLAGELTAPPQEISFEDALSRLQQLSPEVAAAAIEVERACLALRRAQVEPVPNINVEGLVNWQDNGIGGKADGGIAISLPIPLFDKNQGAISRASHEVAAARQALSQINLELQNRLAPVFEQFSNSANQVKRYQETIVPVAEESLELTRQTYSVGETNYTALLTAQRTYSQTQLNYLEALGQLRLAETQIDGLLLSGSLQSSPQSSVSSPGVGRESPRPLMLK
jgi:cobalt-zinc-cadmium efflux system outer membrane protein